MVGSLVRGDVALRGPTAPDPPGDLGGTRVKSTGDARRERRVNRILITLVAIGLFCIYLAIQRQEVLSYDGKIMLSVARNLVSQHSLGTDPAVDMFHTNTPYSTYGIGTSLLLAPFSAIQGTERLDGGFWVTLANPLMLALAAGVMIKIGLALGWARRWAVLAALAFGLLTLAPSQSIELFAEPSVTFFSLLVAWGCLRWQHDDAIGSWLAGIGVGGAMLFRADAILLTGSMLLFLPMFVGLRKLVGEWRRLVGVVVPIAASASVLAWYNIHRYGDVTKFGYGDAGSFNMPLWKGLDELLRLPGKGFFWFNPLLLTAIPGFVWLWRRNRAFTAMIATLAFARVVLYAKWFDPGGGVGWGPRLLLPLCAFLMFPAAEAWQRVTRLRGAWRPALAGVVIMLALVSEGLSVISVWVPYEQHWNDLAAPRPGDRPRVQQHRIDDYYRSIDQGPILGNIRLLDHASRFPLSHFEGGPDLTGILALAGGIAGCGVAVGLAFAADRRRLGTRGDRAGSVDDIGRGPGPLPFGESVETPTPAAR